jgi:CheY-like chemotaxis protein
MSGVDESAAMARQMSLIVIVDDQVTNRRILTRLARSLESVTDVEAFADPLDALAFMAEQTPELIVTDYKMPSMTGSQFTMRCRATMPDVPIVVVTAYEDREFRYLALEAGASDWEPATRTAKQLRAIGIHKVRGFMLNVTHHDWTRNNVRHGAEISRFTGGKHFIVNTSYNGRGPLHYRKWINRAKHKWRRINVWCHPGLRGLGPAPTTATSHPKVDAYMYINRPGYSAGACNGGPLPIGTWWPERGLMYAEYATDWEAPPRGTRHGHFRRYSLRALGAFN